MFRRWSSAPAVAVAAACLLLSPQAAPAQVRVVIGAGPVVHRPLYLSPSYIAPSYRTSFLYYQVGLPYNPVITNPFLYRDPVTPVAYSLTPGVVPGSLAAQGYGSFLARPGIGSFGYYGGYGSVLPPINFGAYTGYVSPNLITPLVNYAGYPSYAYPSFYPAGLPYFSATRVNLGGDTGYLADVYGSGLTTTPYVPGLTASTTTFSPFPPRVRTTMISTPVAKPDNGSEVLFDNAPRARLVATPAVPIRLAATRPADAAADRTARIEVIVPAADAEVRFGGHKTTQTGKSREFVTPPLDPGSYTYEIRVRWTSDGQPSEAARTIQIRPGQRQLVDFTAK
jgi:uncharacterized protein (TIGR03000 family)